MTLQNWYFLLFIPLLIYLFFKRGKKSTLKFSSVKLLKSYGYKNTIKHKIGRYFILTSLILLVVAMARPQLPASNAPVTKQGIDIAIALDVSGSMQSVDFTPNRLEVARQTIQDFVDKRPNDRISLIVFAGTAYTRVPLTLDHNVVRESLQNVSFESVNEDGTAIGMAISVGLNRLKKSNSQSKVIILVTDGANNAGSINPETASELAKNYGIKIYTIGVGSDKTLIPREFFGITTYQQANDNLDEELLTRIAEKTHGKYYRAKDPEALSKVFADIDKFEKTEFEKDDFKQYIELAYILIAIALILLAIGIFLDRYYYIHIP
ncbi:vWA domain-containing protein [Acetivibrio clariflavus]|uniref:N-terminal double-transmembrane domain-containing protein n=1 Tax=Acetivibrio clariflavus (strain DSM 19732 / NBRC 101661 / EBR45) TaxID=720554 RepID=G8LZE4_ACECE|nr:VWA domain-containing protein [Acetivibrio clariflavus]AEV66807.1 N-terminal double-transmembrane domain-containing protein [Acetivibrio clariflavus DSM 19732]